ncbi:MAG: hypothetical protein OXU22_08390, partial [Gammaproteobacteria bacterium]|nr:hypothetical protein [Gammaproteobacteria bacterium]
SFTVTLAGGVRTAPVIVPLSFSGLEDAEFDITAPAGAGAAGTGFDITFDLSGAVTATDSRIVTVDLIDDDLNEGAETLLISGASAGPDGLRTAAGALRYPSGIGAAALVEVSDDDAITVSIANAGIDAHADSGFQVEESTDALFRVTLGGAAGGSSTEVTVAYMVGGDVDADDYSDAGGGILSIAAHTAGGVIAIAIAEDADADAAEDITVTLDATGHSAAGPIARTGTVAGQSATQTIIPSQFAHRLTLTAPAAEIAETDADAATTYTIARRGPDVATGMDLVITWAVAHGTTADADFSGGSVPGGTVTFAGDSTEATFDIGIAGDTLNEANEDFTIAFSIAAANQAAATANGEAQVPADHDVTLSDDDDITVSIGADQAAYAEGESAAFTLTLSGESQADVTVTLALGGSATAVDYIAPNPLSATVDAGDLSAALLLPLIADTDLTEGTETLSVTISAPTGRGVTVATADAQVSFGDVTLPAPVVAAGEDQAVDDGDTVTLDGTVTRGGGDNGSLLAYAWVQVTAADDDTPVSASDDAYVGALTGAAGTPSVELATLGQSLATFTAPNQVTVATYFFRLTGTAGDPGGRVHGASATDIVAVTVNDDDAPTVTVPADFAAYDTAGGATGVSLTAVVGNTDGDAVTYQWAQTAPEPTAQDALTIRLADADKRTVALTYPDLAVRTAQAFTLTFTATDSAGLAATATVTITLRDATRPAARVGNAAIAAAIGRAVSLDASGSRRAGFSMGDDPDDATGLEFAWQQVDGIASDTAPGEVVTLAGATTATPSFTAPGTPATLYFKVTVT